MTLNDFSKNGLIDYLDKGQQVAYLFFWGHRQHKEQIDESCLSQWYPSGFTVDNQYYATAEHFMMAQKALLFNDQESYRKILSVKTPDLAKNLGRQVIGFNELLWQEKRFDIVVRGNLAKFSQHSALQAFLLSTSDKILVEASPTDAIWGIGLSKQAALSTLPTHWPGLNLLGFALMQVRAELASV